METIDKIKDLIFQGESEILELKSSFTKDVILTIVAFSNTKGGTIIIGCNDKREITGVDLSDESIQKWTNEIKQNTEPAVFPSFEVFKVDGKSIVTIIVDEFPIKPVSYRNRFYCRRQNSNHLLSTDEIVELRFISLNYSFDSFPVPDKIDQLDKGALAYF
ncbi:MAG TPA: putative DNA binding domain-containing protein [Bacteroidales bacterium]|nr:putative DNA binding domain-containing protein [Bacteroidales bacterium]